MHAPILSLAFLLALAACATPKEDTPDATPTQEAVPAPTTGGFAPLRPQTVDIPGRGVYVCSPRQDDQPIQCLAQKSPNEAAPSRPGLLPITAQGGAPDLPMPGTPIALPDFTASDEVPMSMPME